jgi:hypothetical protein
LEGKEVKIISSEKEAISNLSKILEGKGEVEIDTKDSITIIYLTEGELDVSPFIITSSVEKVILTNSKNYDAIIKSINELQ